MKQNQFFLEYFLAKKIINKKEYNFCSQKISQADFDLLAYLIDNEKITIKNKFEALSAYLDVPTVDMDYLLISKNFEKYFDIELLKKYNFIPVYFTDDEKKLIIASTDPTNPEMNSIVSMIFDGEVEYILVEIEKVKNVLNSYQAKISTRDALDVISKNIESEQKVYDMTELSVQNAPSVKFVDSIIREAIPLRASDIHIEPNDDNVIVRYRIDGDLIKWTEFPAASYPEISARLKILSNIDIAEKRVPQDGRIVLNINGEDINFRVSTLPTIHGEKFVIRVLDNKIFSYSLKELNFSKESLRLIEKILQHPHGIVLLTGPTGSGKTTTLYAFLRELNDGKKNIVTIEDPVEFDMNGINQLQINNKANLTFASSLRSILRQDPDIIMVGEIRDEETAQIATRAAITGHMVLSTLHTNDAPGAVIRLVDMGIPQYLVTDATVAVISQRLVKKLCPHCKKRMQVNKTIANMLGIKENEYIYKPSGCQYCNHTGYRGRTAVHEILYFDNELKLQLNSGEVSFDKLKKLAKKNGMITLDESCKKYVIEGITSLDEYLSITMGDGK